MISQYIYQSHELVKDNVSVPSYAGIFMTKDDQGNWFVQSKPKKKPTIDLSDARISVPSELLSCNCNVLVCIYWHHIDDY